VSANVEPEEAEAIRELVSRAGERLARGAVEARDFTHPRRLAETRLRELSRRIAARLPEAARAMSAVLRASHALQLGSVGEFDASELLEGAASPAFVWCFRCGDEPGWLVWETMAALRAAETILSGRAESEAERRLSPSECQVLDALLRVVAGAVAGALGCSVQGVRVAQAPGEITHPDGPHADARRLMVHLSFDGPGGESEMRLYLPCSFVEAGAQKAPRPKALPAHFDSVPVELHAYLSSIDIPLDELMKLEVGDVIPLARPAGAPLELWVEGRACALASWGKHRGRLAVRIEELRSQRGDGEDSPLD